MIKDSNKKFFPIVYLIVAALFLVVGIVMVFVDHQYFRGITYVMTAVFLFVASYFFLKKFTKEHYDPKLNLGFIFMIVGQNFESLGISMWALGVIFFIGGFFTILKKEKE